MKLLYKFYQPNFYSIIKNTFGRCCQILFVEIYFIYTNKIDRKKNKEMDSFIENFLTTVTNY